MALFPLSAVRPAELQRERAHYAVIRALSGSTPFNAVRYLYDRLNIIDAKTSALLRFDAFFLAALSLLAAVPRNDHKGLDVWAQWVLLVAFFSLVISTGICFVMFRLRFDNVTAPSAQLIDRLAECSTIGCSPQNCTTLPRCSRAALILELANLGVRPPTRLIEDYEDTFFCITIRRQRYLRWALRLSGLSGLLFAVLVLGEVTPSLMPSITSLVGL